MEDACLGFEGYRMTRLCIMQMISLMILSDSLINNPPMARVLYHQFVQSKILSATSESYELFPSAMENELWKRW